MGTLDDTKPRSEFRPIADFRCQGLKIDPCDARERQPGGASDIQANPELAKAREQRSAWQWVIGSDAEKGARRALQPRSSA